MSEGTQAQQAHLHALVCTMHMPGVGLCTLMYLPYIRSARRVEEDDFGGHQELVTDGLPVAFGTFLVGDGGTCVREQQRAAFHTADSLSQEHQGTCHSAPPVAAAVGRCSQMAWHKQPHIARSWLTLACPPRALLAACVDPGVQCNSALARAFMRTGSSALTIDSS